MLVSKLAQTFRGSAECDNREGEDDTCVTVVPVISVPALTRAIKMFDQIYSVAWLKGYFSSDLHNSNFRTSRY